MSDAAPVGNGARREGGSAEGTAEGTAEGPGEGSVLGGKYRLTRRLGDGAMGVVFRGVHERLGREVAVKILRPDMSAYPDAVARFQREAELVTRIGHPGIVTVYDYGRAEDGSVYYVMELIGGRPLRARLQEGPLSDGEVVDVFAPLLAAVQSAHAVGAVHRDLKPENVMLVAPKAEGAPEREGRAGPPQIKLLDFGVAKIRQDAGSAGAAPAPANDNLQTRAGTLMGTPAYMAPEQIRNSSTVDARADIYAIGVILFEALTGERPFRGATLADLIGAHLFQPPPRPSEVSKRKGLPPRRVSWKKLDQTVLKALAKDPAARYPDCASLRRDLDEAWGRAGTFTEEPDGTGPLPAGRSFVLAGVAGAVLIAGLGIGTGLLLKQRRPAPVEPPPITQAADRTPRGRALAQLQAALRGDVSERRAVVASLDAVRSRALAPLLVTALRDENPAVWRTAVPVAVTSERPGSDHEPELLAALTARSAEAVGPLAVDLAAARRRLGATDATAVLHAAGSSDSLPAEVRLRAATVLCDAGELEPGLLQKVLERLSRFAPPPPAVRQTALVQLLRAGDAVTSRQLVTAARSPATESGREALAVLARAGRVDAAERLRELAESEASAERRLDLLVSLAAVGDARAVPALKAQLGSPQPRSRQRAAAALGSLGPAAAPAVSELVPLLDDADRQVALTAAAALVAILPPARQPNGAG